MLLSMKSVCKNNRFFGKMTQASSGSERKIISRAIGQFVFGISDFFLIGHKLQISSTLKMTIILSLVITIRPKKF